MSTREVTAIAIKILAIWMALEVFLFSPVFLSLFLQLKGSASITFQVLLVLVYFAVGLLLAFVLFQASSAVLRTSDTQSSNVSVSEGFILQVAGAFFIVSAFEGLAGVSMTIVKASSAEAREVMYLAAYSSELIVGLVMTVKREVFVKFFRVLRGRA
ncbi:hypothetical protein [Haliea salexigens]|uniref:hypothetical protein n=1 Tax=Haliea salexigens TaxID=287487 RepID=UPI00047F6927|nr:hypothetical protein [Haliea salexigens]